MFTPDVRPAKVELLRFASLANLHPLSFEQRVAIASCAEERHLPAGGRLLLDGPLHQELVLIGSGRAAVRCAGERVAELAAGDSFGALAPDRATYATALVVALTDLRLAVFGTRALRALSETAPEAFAALMSACSIDPGDRSATQAGDRPVPHLTVVAAAAA